MSSPPKSLYTGSRVGNAVDRLGVVSGVVRRRLVAMAGVFGRLWSSRMVTGPVPS